MISVVWFSLFLIFCFVGNPMALVFFFLWLFNVGGSNASDR